MNKNNSFLLFVLQNRGPSTITEIMKLLYLIDLASIKELGKKISSFTYKRYFYGPYTNEIQSSLEELAECSKIRIEAKTNTQGYENILYSIFGKIDLENSISEDEANFTLHILNDLAPYRAKALTDIAYKTKPMLDIGATLGGNEGLNESLI